MISDTKQVTPPTFGSQEAVRNVFGQLELPFQPVLLHVADLLLQVVLGHGSQVDLVHQLLVLWKWWSGFDENRLPQKGLGIGV